MGINVCRCKLDVYIGWRGVIGIADLRRQSDDRAREGVDCWLFFFNLAREMVQIVN